MSLRQRLEAVGKIIREGSGSQNGDIAAAVDAAQTETLLIAVEALVGIDESLRAVAESAPLAADALRLIGSKMDAIAGAIDDGMSSGFPTRS